jgi:hypothetical protein
MSKRMNKFKSNAPSWLVSLVADGLQRLIMANLQNPPAAETIVATAKAWADALWMAPITWDSTLDGERVTNAFRRAASLSDRFPSPQQVIKLMPPRAQLRELPKPQLTREQKMANLTRLREATQGLLKDASA